MCSSGSQLPDVYRGLVYDPASAYDVCKKTAIGVGILKKPARIHGKEIQVVFLLAMEHKQNEQIGVLFEFFRHMAQNRSAIGRLAAVETEEEFVEVLIRISNSLES